MSESERKKFVSWHSSQNGVFYLQKDLEEYC